MICGQALQQILGYGRDAWKTIKYYAKKNEIPKHGLIGKHGKKMNIVMLEEVFDYFTETKQHAAPRATQLARRMTQLEEEAEAMFVYEVRDGDFELVELPTHWDKTSLYKHYFNLNGWHPLYDSKHRLLRMKSIDGAKGEVTAVSSQRTFNRYWSKHFPKLVTQRAREDVCGDCFAFASK